MEKLTAGAVLTIVGFASIAHGADLEPTRTSTTLHVSGGVNVGGGFEPYNTQETRTGFRLFEQTTVSDSVSAVGNVGSFATSNSEASVFVDIFRAGTNGSIFASGRIRGGARQNSYCNDDRSVCNWVGGSVGGSSYFDLSLKVSASYPFVFEASVDSDPNSRVYFYGTTHGATRDVLNLVGGGNAGGPQYRVVRGVLEPGEYNVSASTGAGKNTPYPFTDSSASFENDWKFELRRDETYPIRLTLPKQMIAGCKSVSGTVTLRSPAPAGGSVVTITDTLSSAVAPARITVPEGATSKKFTIKTSPVASIEDGRVYVAVNGVKASHQLTVRPIGVQSLALSPPKVVGGLPSIGTVMLECPAAPGAVTVDLYSKYGRARAITPQIDIAQAMQSGTVQITTRPVAAASSEDIEASAGHTTRTSRIALTVAPVASPASLNFGAVPVGATSAAKVVTLTNKGVQAFAISSLALAGTYASWFLQSSSCPATLPAGASCAINVRFKPKAAAARSATLQVATDVTVAPVVVSVSGAGL